MFKKRKGQAAMEFLMTYGWAILVVLTVIGALAYFGVLTPDSLLPEKCSLTVGMYCQDFSVTDNDITLKVMNSGGRDFLITHVNITSEALLNPCGNSFSKKIKNGEMDNILISGCPAKDDGRGKKKYAVQIQYNLVDSTMSKTLQGDLFSSQSKKNPLVYDDFESGSINPLIWATPDACTSIYTDNGNKVIKKSSGCSSSFTRVAASLRNDYSAKFDFKMDSSDGTAFYVFYSILLGYQGIGISNGQINSYSDNAPLLPIEANTWYTAYYKLDSLNGLFYIKIYKKNDPNVYGEHSRSISTKNQIMRFYLFDSAGNAFLDNYMESG